jgi:glutathione peroxidase
MSYGVTFPLFAKIEVNGPGAHPLYTWMRSEQAGNFDKDAPGADKLYAHLQKTMPEVLNTDAVKWNFTKFLVGRTGRVLRRYAPTDTPEAIESDLIPLLK